MSEVATQVRPAISATRQCVCGGWTRYVVCQYCGTTDPVAVAAGLMSTTPLVQRSPDPSEALAPAPAAGPHAELHALAETAYPGAEPNGHAVEGSAAYAAYPGAPTAFTAAPTYAEPGAFTQPTAYAQPAEFTDPNGYTDPNGHTDPNGYTDPDGFDAPAALHPLAMPQATGRAFPGPAAMPAAPAPPQADDPQPEAPQPVQEGTGRRPAWLIPAIGVGVLAVAGGAYLLLAGGSSDDSSGPIVTPHHVTAVVADPAADTAVTSTRPAGWSVAAARPQTAAAVAAGLGGAAAATEAASLTAHGFTAAELLPLSGPSAASGTVVVIHLRSAADASAYAAGTSFAAPSVGSVRVAKGAVVYVLGYDQLRPSLKGGFQAWGTRLTT